MPSAASRGTRSRRSRSLATSRRDGELVGLLREGRVLRGELAGRLDVVAELEPLLPGRDDGGQLGVALVELLGQALVGVRLGESQSLLDLGVLLAHAFDGLEHRTPSRFPQRLDRRQGAGHPHGAGDRRLTWTTCSRRSRSLLGRGLLGVARLEAGDAAAGVEDLLLAGVERVALRADIGVDRAGGRGAAGGERRTARAGDGGLDVVGVSVLLHGVLSGVPGRPRGSQLT